MKLPVRRTTRCGIGSARCAPVSRPRSELEDRVGCLVDGEAVEVDAQTEVVAFKDLTVRDRAPSGLEQFLTGLISQRIAGLRPAATVASGKDAPGQLLAARGSARS
jgi:hypothetical protein